MRHERQRRLVGGEGQGRIASARATVDSSGGLAAFVEGRYLVGAGVAEVTVPDGATAAALGGVDDAVVVRVQAFGTRPPHAVPSLDGLGLEDPSARAVAAGALHALLTLRHALEEGDR